MQLGWVGTEATERRTAPPYTKEQAVESATGAKWQVACLFFCPPGRAP